MPKTPPAFRRIQRSLAGVALLVALLLPAGAAQAEAIVFRFSETHPETLTAPLEGCLPGDPVATWTLTETATGQVVDTGTVFTIRGVNEFDNRVELPDGMYLESGRIDRDRYIFVANSPLTVFNIVTQEQRTIYAADGTPLGTMSIHAGYHITFRDLNGNEMPDPGEISAEHGYFRVHCG